MAVLDTTSDHSPTAASPAPFGSSSARSFVTTWAALVLFCLLPIAIFNLVVDPFGIYQLIRINRLDGHRDTGSSRITKAELLHHQPADIVIVGSSRAETGIDPASPHWGTTQVLNLGLADTNMDELADVCRYAVRSGRVRKIILFVDFHIFRDTHMRFDFDRSRFNQQLDLPNYYLASLLSSYKTTTSIETIHNARSGTPSPHNSRGFRYQYSPSRELLSHREMFRAVLRADMTSGVKYPYHASPDQIALVGQTIDYCRQNGVGLTIVLAPMHALKLEQLRALSLWPDIEQLKRNLTRIVETRRGPSNQPVPLWDFITYNEHSTEEIPDQSSEPAENNPMRWWWEASHFKSSLGQLVIAQINGKSPDNALGTLLNSKTLDANLKTMRQDRDLYAAKHPQEMAFINEIAAGTGVTPPPP